VDHHEHSLETVRAAVIRVRNRQVSVRFRIKFSKEREDPLPSSSVGDAPKVPEVVPVHRHDPVEGVKVFGSDLPRRSGELDSMTEGHLDRT
jgi:hypothetical protein